MSIEIGPWLGSILAVTLVSVLPLAVTLLMAQREDVIRRVLPQLTAFGAGAVLAAAVGHIIPEALRDGQSVEMVALLVVVGYGMFWAIERILAGHDHAHAHGIALGAPSAHESELSAANCEHLNPVRASGLWAANEMKSSYESDRTDIDGHVHAPGERHGALVTMTFVGDAIHNLVDGMLIAASFLAGTSVGVLTLIAVALHELPREVGTFSLFVHGGVRPLRAVGYNLVTAVMAMLGAFLTLMAGERLASMGTWLLPIAAGTYIYIALIVGRSALRERQSAPIAWSRLGWSGLGMALTLGSALLV